MSSVIKITAAKLRTVEGQAAVCAAMDMEAALDNRYGFEGTPSLRDLLVEKMDQWPFSDNLFRIYVEVPMVRYQDSTDVGKWREHRITEVKCPKVVAAYVNHSNYEAVRNVVKLPWNILEEAYPLMHDTAMLGLTSHILFNCPRILRPKYMAHTLRANLPNAWNMRELVSGYCKAWGNDPKLIKAMVNLTNKYLRRKLANKNSAPAVFQYCSGLLKATHGEYKFEYELYNPATMDVAEFVDNILKEDTDES